MEHFDQIYRESADIVYRYLFSLTRNQDLSEELTQQTFYEALRQSGKYRGDAAPSTYLCGIAKNLLKKELTRRARQAHVPLGRTRNSCSMPTAPRPRPWRMTGGQSSSAASTTFPSGCGRWCTSVWRGSCPSGRSALFWERARPGPG